MASANSLFLPKRLADAYFGSGTFKFMLVASVPDETELDTFDFRSDVTDEVVASGYTAGGVAVSVSVGAVDTVNNRVAVTFADQLPMLASATLSGVPGGWIYKAIGSAATDELVTFVQFTVPLSSTSGPVNVDFTSPLYINA